MQYLVALVEDTPSSSLFYMREFGVTLHGSPVFYKYIDWLITIPLQIIEFYKITVTIFNQIAKQDSHNGFLRPTDDVAIQKF